MPVRTAAEEGRSKLRRAGRVRRGSVGGAGETIGLEAGSVRQGRRRLTTAAASRAAASARLPPGA